MKRIYYRPFDSRHRQLHRREMRREIFSTITAAAITMFVWAVLVYVWITGQ